MIFLTIPDLDTLHTTYMPFIKNGGLFVPTAKQYNLGDTLKISLSLPDDMQQYTLSGTVIWLTPEGAQTGSPAGIGIQFDNTEQAQAVNQKIMYALEYDRTIERMTSTL